MPCSVFARLSTTVTTGSATRLLAEMIYCVIPQALADELYDKMVAYYEDDPNVTVIIDRRQGVDRRRAAGNLSDERRVIRDRRKRRATGSFPPTFEGD